MTEIGRQEMEGFSPYKILTFLADTLVIHRGYTGGFLVPEDEAFP
jgi:hypothetical protein